MDADVQFRTTARTKDFDVVFFEMFPFEYRPFGEKIVA
jgi:hypothetical protein